MSSWLCSPLSASAPDAPPRRSPAAAPLAPARGRAWEARGVWLGLTPGQQQPHMGSRVGGEAAAGAAAGAAGVAALLFPERTQSEECNGTGRAGRAGLEARAWPKRRWRPQRILSGRTKKCTLESRRPTLCEPVAVDSRLSSGSWESRWGPRCPATQQ